MVDRAPLPYTAWKGSTPWTLGDDHVVSLRPDGELPEEPFGQVRQVAGGHEKKRGRTVLEERLWSLSTAMKQKVPRAEWWSVKIITVVIAKGITRVRRSRCGG